MEQKNILSLSIIDLLDLTESDVKAAQKQDLIREKKLQFIAAHAQTIKKINDQEKIIQDNLLNVEEFDVNTIVEAELALDSQKEILAKLKERHGILFPGSKLDVLES